MNARRRRDGIHYTDPVTGPKLNRAQRRQLKKIAAYAERASTGDRLFFERFPQRRTRIRLSSACEIEELRIVHDEPMTLAPGLRWFTVVRNFAQGVRARRFVLNTEDAETDTGEALAALVWEELAPPQAAAMEAAVRRIVEKRS
jgi:hypothetical protein